MAEVPVAPAVRRHRTGWAVPTRIGCGAVSNSGTCDTGCSEHKLELVKESGLSPPTIECPWAGRLRYGATCG